MEICTFREKKMLVKRESFGEKLLSKRSIYRVAAYQLVLNLVAPVRLQTREITTWLWQPFETTHRLTGTVDALTGHELHPRIMRV